MNNEKLLYSIDTMIKVAESKNLLTEVIWSFGMSCRNNKPLENKEYAACCNEALNEWDI